MGDPSARDGAITAAAGGIIGDIGPYGTYIVAAVFFVVGLHLLDVIPLPLSAPGQVGMKRRGLVLAYIMRFKQICNHPSQLLGDGAYEPADSGKFERLRVLDASTEAVFDYLMQAAMQP